MENRKKFGRDIVRWAKLNWTLSLILLLYYVFLKISENSVDKISFYVALGLFAVDSVFMLKPAKNWKAAFKFIRILVIFVNSFQISFGRDYYAFIIMGAYMLLNTCEILVVVNYYTDDYMRLYLFIILLIPSEVVTIFRMVSADYQPNEILGMGIGVFVVHYVAANLMNFSVDEIDVAENNYLYQERRAEISEKNNILLERAQDRVKEANEDLARQAIRLESAYKKINVSNSEMSLQNDILQKLVSSLDMEALLSVMVSTLRNELGLMCCAIYILPDTAGNDMSMFSVSMTEEIAFDMKAQRIITDFIRPFAMEGSTLIDNNVEKGKYVLSDLFTPFSIMVLPIKRKDDVMGSMLVASGNIDAFNDNSMFYENVVSQFVVAFENASLYARMQDMAVKDPLTGIFNRGKLNVMIDSYGRRAIAEKKKVVAFLFDIDHFKNVNDTYGHLFGDKVIKMVSEKANHLARDNGGIAARYGGEEFVVAFLDKSLEEGVELAEKLRKNISETACICDDGRRVFVQISVGVAAYPETADDPNLLLNRADVAMYYSKQHGRNRVTVDSEKVRKEVN